MSAISILLAWTIIPFACFMVFYVVREIWMTSKESSLKLETTLQDRAFHRNRTVG